MSKKVVEYETFFRNDADHLDLDINKNLKDGWELYGNPYADSSGFIYQAMVKYEENWEGYK